MKMTIDIPQSELSDAIRFPGATTKREAVVTAIAEFYRRRRIAALAKYASTCPNLMTVSELQKQRRRKKATVPAPQG